MDYRDKVRNIINRQGPVTPSQIAKELGTDTMLASAMLGEMASNRHLKITKLKVGSSPLYYLPEQASKLQEFITKLNSKDQESCEELRNKKVLRDKDLTPLLRTSLRNIQDYAIMLEVSHSGETETFWKWY